MSLHEALPQPWTAATLLVAGGILAGLLARLLILRVALPLARRTPTDLDEIVVEASATPAALTFAAFGVAAAAWRVQPADDLIVRRVLVSALVLVWGWTLARLLSRLLLHRAKHLQGREQTRGIVILSRLASLIVAVLLLLTLLAMWNVSITPLVASAGIAGIALALAAQDTLANLFAGIAIYMDRIYEVGDYVVLDQGSGEELRGEVRDIGLRSTRVLTRDDVLIIVPNSVIANGRVVNESATRGRYRVRVRVRVSLASDLDHVERVLLDVASRAPSILRDPEPRVRVRAFEDSGVAIELLVWIHEPSQRGVVVSDVSKAVHRRFREEGIEIPLPQRVIRQA